MGVLRKAIKVGIVFDAFLKKIVQEHIDRVNLRSHDDKGDKGDKVQDLVDVLLEMQRNDTLIPPLKGIVVKLLFWNRDNFHTTRMGNARASYASTSHETTAMLGEGTRKRLHHNRRG